MHVFVWSYVDEVTDNYHSGGGLLVVAASEQRARELANGEPHVKLLDTDAVSHSWPIDGYAVEYVEVFRDAGCC